VSGERVTLTLQATEELSRRALGACGASEEVARVMAEALVLAEAQGLAGVGLAHLESYCEALREGRIDGHAEPVIRRDTPVLFHADAKGGVGHVGFERVLPDLVAAARELGVAVFSQRNSYTNAALDWFVRRLAERGLVALAATNGGPALLAASGAREAVFCTNPMAFAAPRDDGPPLVIDQSSSATAYVNLRLAAERGDPIPRGWALDGYGRETTDPVAALEGVLLPFGGARGANVALMVELLAAGLAGANWSLDAPSFLEGDATPGIGLFVLALDGDRLAGMSFGPRMKSYLTRLQREFDVYLPGSSRAQRAASAARQGIEIPTGLHERLLQLCA
jgi:(2R)-3-sulfolactate dehydrogenase (NADP+)